MNKKVHMNIGGMTCIHCQNTIEKTLKNAKGVIKASVSYKRGTADIEYDDSVTHVNKLVRVIENEDYKVLSSGEKTSPGVLDTLGILVIIAALYYLLQTFGLLNRLVPDRLADSGMGYGMLFVIGLIIGFGYPETTYARGVQKERGRKIHRYSSST
jgi:copper chaperone CopZ